MTSFIVRMGVRRDTGLYGEVQHIATGDRIIFRDEDTFLEFLRNRLDRPGPQAGQPEENHGG